MRIGSWQLPSKLAEGREPSGVCVSCHEGTHQTAGGLLILSFAVQKVAGTLRVPSAECVLLRALTGPLALLR